MDGKVLLLLLFASTVANCQQHSVLSMLRREVFRGYDKMVKPDSRVNSTMGLTVINLRHDATREVLRTDGWLKTKWTDRRLSWNPQLFGGITEIKVPATEVWIPDFTVYNAINRANMISSHCDRPTNVIVYSTGDMLQVPPMSFETVCNVNTRSTTQECTFIIGSWTESMAGMDVKADGKTINFDDFQNRHVSIKESTVKREEKKYPCCTDNYVSLKFNIKFEPQAP